MNELLVSIQRLKCSASEVTHTVKRTDPGEILHQSAYCNVPLLTIYFFEHSIHALKVIVVQKPNCFVFVIFIEWN